MDKHLSHNPTFEAAIAHDDVLSPINRNATGADEPDKPLNRKGSVSVIPQAAIIPKVTFTSSFEMTRSSEDPRSDAYVVRKEGWLIKINKRKKKQERYFRLIAGVLSWSKSPTEKELNGIDLASAKIDLSTDARIRIAAVKKEGNKLYVLTSSQRTNSTLDSWATALLVAQESRMYQTGWLTKKGKRFWCLLQNNILYCFSREQDPCSDFRKAIQEHVKLHGCTVRDVDRVNFELTFPETASSKKIQHVFTARLAEEKTAWLIALQRSLERNSLNLQSHEKFGWLRVKGQKRFVLLNDGMLSWYKSPEEVKALGSILMEYHKVRPSSEEELSFQVYSTSSTTPTSESYTFVAADQEELDGWMAVLNRAEERQRSRTLANAEKISQRFSGAQIAKSGWATYKGKRRFFILQDIFLLWFSQPPVTESGELASSELAGNVSVQDAHITKSPDFSFTIRTPHGKSYTFYVHTTHDVDSWVASLIAAVSRGTAGNVNWRGTQIIGAYSNVSRKKTFVQFKGKKCVMEMSDSALLVAEASDSSKVICDVSLEGSSCSLFGKYSFMIVPISGRPCVFSCGEAEAREWADTIALQIIKSNDAMTNGLEKKGWLLVNRGKYMWFALKNGRLLWYHQPQPFDKINEATAKGSVLISECKPVIRSTESANTFELLLANGSRLGEYRTESEAELSAWLEVLQNHKKGVSLVSYAQQHQTKEGASAKDVTNASSASSSAALSNVIGSKIVPNAQSIFGRDLHELMTYERSVLKSTEEVPRVVKHIVETLCENSAAALSQKEPFQAPQINPSVRQYMNALNDGADLQWKQISTTDLVALLKQFLRRLPDPLLCHSLFSQLMAWEAAEGDSAQLQKLVSLLPDDHLRLFRYLIQFFTRIECMDPYLIAMVFAPMMMRPPPTDLSLSDKCLLQAVQIVKTCIVASAEIFPGLTNNQGSFSSHASFNNLDKLLSRTQAGEMLSLRCDDDERKTIMNEVSSLAMLIRLADKKPPAQPDSVYENDNAIAAAAATGTFTPTPTSGVSAVSDAGELATMLTKLRGGQGSEALRKLKPADRATVMHGLHNLESLLSDLRDWKPTGSQINNPNAASPQAGSTLLHSPQGKNSAFQRAIASPTASPQRLASPPAAAAPPSSVALPLTAAVATTSPQSLSPAGSAINRPPPAKPSPSPQRPLNTQPPTMPVAAAQTPGATQRTVASPIQQRHVQPPQLANTAATQNPSPARSSSLRKLSNAPALSAVDSHSLATLTEEEKAERRRTLSMSIDKKRAELLDTDRRRKELEDKRTQLAQERKRKEDQDSKAREASAAVQKAVDPATRERLRKQAEEEEYIKQLVHQELRRRELELDRLKQEMLSTNSSTSKQAPRTNIRTDIDELDRLLAQDFGATSSSSRLTLDKMLAQVEEETPPGPSSVTPNLFDRSIQRSMLSMVGHLPASEFPQPHISSSSAASITSPLAVAGTARSTTELDKMLRELPSQVGDVRDLQRSMMGYVNEMQKQQEHQPPQKN